MRSPSVLDPQLDVVLDAEEWVTSMRAEARAGLSADPKQLTPTWFYDDRGSSLFDEITRLPEYYPTRTERSILEREAATIVERSCADTLVELGSGTSEKTRILLDAFSKAARLRRFVPFDISEGVLVTSAHDVAREYPGVEVRAVVGDFRRHLDAIPVGGRRLVAFLGGTIGNLLPAERALFLGALAETLVPGDTVLLGTDLVKDRGRLVAAYDDAAGVTAEFNKNVLEVLNREVGADFDPRGFSHVAVYDDDNDWIEMRLRATRAMEVELPGLDLTIQLDAGEEIRTEVSAKFTTERVHDELRHAGLEVLDTWTDDAGDFALTLARR